jgi:hypothetical protein
VTCYSIKPGQGDAFWKDFRENIKPLYEEYKKAGFILEYKAFINPLLDHPPPLGCGHRAFVSELCGARSTRRERRVGGGEALWEPGGGI